MEASVTPVHIAPPEAVHLRHYGDSMGWWEDGRPPMLMSAVDFMDGQPAQSLAHAWKSPHLP